MTVLVVDVVPAEASTVGPERLREIRKTVFDRSAVVVQRYGGTIDTLSDDGIAALFGAPVALDDHALRGCLAALSIQQEAARLADELARRDNIEFLIRVGVDSGQLAAEDIGAASLSGTAFGQHVLMAQRVKSVAPPGAVMVSESTARLVENAAVLGEAELVRIEGADVPISVRQLLKTVADPVLTGRREWTLIGRHWEMRALTGLLDEAIAGRGCVVGVVGVPGIGKTRLAREVARIANELGAEVYSTFCESHSIEVPFHVVARMLRAVFRVTDVDDAAARAIVRARFPAADPDDVALLDDLIGISDGGVTSPGVETDARRRRLTRLVNTALLARVVPALYVVEDAHWIDTASEAMFAEFFSVIPRTPAIVLVTYRPDYRGSLTRTPGSQTIALAPLSDSQTTMLTVEMLGAHPSLKALTTQVAERAVGNPFFAEEIVRDLVDRGVLQGDWGSYVSSGDATDIGVPATVQATVAARIDRLEARAARTLNAAAVIGLRFDEETLTSVLDDVALAELLDAELIYPAVFTPHLEYAFRHPLIRTVAYESQSTSERAELHRCLARAIGQRNPTSLDENAALIATHLEAAGDLREAFDWHMRSASWSKYRDIGATRLSWQRARQLADRLPVTEPDRLSMRVAPRTLLCGSVWHTGGDIADAGFEELRELTSAAGDRRSLAIGMAGLVCLLAFRACYRESLPLASECVELIESVGDPAMTVGLLYGPTYAKYQAGAAVAALHLAQRRIDLAAGDFAKGNLILGSPLALGFAERGAARCCLGMSGWLEDFDEAIAMARQFDPTTRVIANWFKYGTIPNGTLLPDAVALQDTAETLQVAEQFADDFNLALARLTRGLVLVQRGGADREAGFELLAAARETAVQKRCPSLVLPLVDTQVAKEKARTGDLDGAIDLAQAVVDDEFDTGEMIYRGAAVTVLVESLLRRGGSGDLARAQAAIDRLAAVPTDPGFVLHELPLLRLRALVASQRGDRVGYRKCMDRYRTAAASCGFEGHLAICRVDEMKLTTPVTGREDELNVIRRTLSGTGKPCGVVIVGAEGVGKTWLARTALNRAETSAERTSWVVGTESTRRLPLGAFAASFGAAMPDPTSGMRDLINSFVSQQAQRRAVIGVDDAHLLDGLSAHVVHQLARTQGVRLVVTLRSGGGEPEAVTALRKDGLLTRLDLEPLPAAPAGHMIETIVGGPVDQRSVQRFMRLSGGNALLLQQLVTEQLAAGRMRQAAGEWLWDDNVVVPSSAEDIAGRQLSRLDPGVALVVDTLSQCEPLPLEVLCDLVRRRDLDVAERLHLVAVERSATTLLVRLAHPLFGELRRVTAGEIQLSRIRGQLAQRLAKAADPDLHATVRRALLAMESDVAPDPDLFLRSARFAVTLLDLELADQFATAAAKAGAPEAASLRAMNPVLLGRGDEAEALLRAMRGHHWSTVRAANLIWMLGRPRDASTLLAGLAATTESAAQRAERAAVESCVDVVLANCESAAEKASFAMRSGQLPDFHAMIAAVALVIALGALGRADDIADVAGEALDRAMTTFAASHMQFWFGSVYVRACRLTGRIDDCVRTANQIADSVSDIPGLAYPNLGFLLGHAELARGAVTSAVSLLSEAGARAEKYGVAMGSRTAGYFALAEAHAKLGQAAAADEALRQARDCMPPDYLFLQTTLSLASGWTLAAGGSLGDAIATVQSAAKDARDRDQLTHELACLQAAAQWGDASGAGRARELADTWSLPLADAIARHTESLRTGDGEGLLAAADDYRAIGDRATAADAAAQAAVVFSRGQQARRAGHAAALAGQLADECGGLSTPALRAPLAVTLTARQREVVELLLAGLSNREIAERLVTSVRTVEGHVYQACQRLGVTSREGLVAILRAGPSGPRGS